MIGQREQTNRNETAKEKNFNFIYSTTADYQKILFWLICSKKRSISVSHLKNTFLSLLSVALFGCPCHFPIAIAVNGFKTVSLMDWVDDHFQHPVCHLATFSSHLTYYPIHPSIDPIDKWWYQFQRVNKLWNVSTRGSQRGWGGHDKMGEGVRGGRISFGSPVAHVRIQIIIITRGTKCNVWISWCT